MKRLLFLLLLFGTTLSAQEQVSQEVTIITQPDNTTLVQTVTIVNTGIEGVNDTLTQYSLPADSTELVRLLYTLAQNEANTAVALLGRAFSYRKFNSTQNQWATLIENQGGSLDSFNVVQYGNQLKGRWRYVDSLGNERFFDLIDHPSRVDRLRMDEDGGANENLNFTIDARWRFTVRLDGTNQSFVWTQEDRNRPKFFLDRNWMPGASLPDGSDNRRFIKID